MARPPRARPDRPGGYRCGSDTRAVSCAWVLVIHKYGSPDNERRSSRSGGRSNFFLHCKNEVTSLFSLLLVVVARAREAESETREHVVRGQAWKSSLACSRRREPRVLSQQQ